MDDHADPLRELRRLLRVAHEIHNFKTALPTTDNFSGMIDRPSIKLSRKQRKKDGRRDMSALLCNLRIKR